MGGLAVRGRAGRVPARISGSAPFGPFHSLRTYGGMQIVSKGHLAGTGLSAGDYHAFTAMILPAEDSHPLASQAGTIVNQATADDPLPRRPGDLRP